MVEMLSTLAPCGIVCTTYKTSHVIFFRISASNMSCKCVQECFKSVLISMQLRIQIPNGRFYCTLSLSMSIIPTAIVLSTYKIGHTTSIWVSAYFCKILLCKKQDIFPKLLFIQLPDNHRRTKEPMVYNHI